MTVNEFAELLKTTKFPVTEAEFKKSVEPPCLILLKSIDKSIYANGIAVVTNIEVELELYTERDDNKSERILCDLLNENGINFTMTERAWISEEDWYQTVFKVLLYG